jgi:hypothetical protein
MAKAKAKAKAPAPKTVDDISPSLFEALDIIKAIEASPANRSNGTVVYTASKENLDALRRLIGALA